MVCPKLGRILSEFRTDRPRPAPERSRARRIRRFAHAALATTILVCYPRRSGLSGAVCPTDVCRGDGTHHRGRGRVARSARDQAGEGASRRLSRDPPAPAAGALGGAVARGAAPRRGDARAEARRQSPRSEGGRTRPAPAAGAAGAAARGARCVMAGRRAALARGSARARVAGTDAPARALRAGLLLRRTTRAQLPLDRGERAAPLRRAVSVPDGAVRSSARRILPMGRAAAAARAGAVHASYPANPPAESGRRFREP